MWPFEPKLEKMQAKGDVDGPIRALGTKLSICAGEPPRLGIALLFDDNSQQHFFALHRIVVSALKYCTSLPGSQPLSAVLHQGTNETFRHLAGARPQMGHEG